MGVRVWALSDSGLLLVFVVWAFQGLGFALGRAAPDTETAVLGPVTVFSPSRPPACPPRPQLGHAGHPKRRTLPNPKGPKYLTMGYLGFPY